MLIDTNVMYLQAIGAQGQRVSQANANLTDRLIYIVYTVLFYRWFWEKDT